jgi:predicted CXXCH cytochrome family protein
MSLVLALFGCGQSEEPKPKPKQQIEKAVSAKPTEPVKTAAGEVKEATEVVAAKAADVKDQAEPAGKETVEEITKETIAEAKEATSEADETVAEETKSATIATTAAVGGVETAQQAVSPKTVVLDASYGKVTFPHTLHAEAYDCTTCHGEGIPGRFGLGKEKAHALCKGCHKEVGAGPTGCKDCHVK